MPSSAKRDITKVHRLSYIPDRLLKNSYQWERNKLR